MLLQRLKSVDFTGALQLPPIRAMALTRNAVFTKARTGTLPTGTGLLIFAEKKGLAVPASIRMEIHAGNRLRGGEIYGEINNHARRSSCELCKH